MMPPLLVALPLQARERHWHSNISNGELMSKGSRWRIHWREGISHSGSKWIFVWPWEVTSRRFYPKISMWLSQDLSGWSWYTVEPFQNIGAAQKECANHQSDRTKFRGRRKTDKNNTRFSDREVENWASLRNSVQNCKTMEVCFLYFIRYHLFAKLRKNLGLHTLRENAHTT